MLIFPKNYWRDRQTDLIVCLTVTGTPGRMALTGFIAWFIIEWGHYTDEPDGLDYVIPFPILLDRPERIAGPPDARVIADYPLDKISVEEMVKKTS